MTTFGAVVLCLAYSSSATFAASVHAAAQPSAVAQGEQKLQRLRQAADRGDAAAQYELGLAYARGEGVAREPALAIEWWVKAAAQGFADAQNALGVMYDDGAGVVQDPARAREWYRKAAEQGHAGAQNNLAFMYEVGRGVGLDYAEALKWYRRAADQGWPAAQVSLGLMYAGGAGVERDLTEALKWFEVAATLASGDEQTKYAGLRDAIQPKMTPESVADARQRARGWLERFERRR
jgi:TPR repeat protein